MGEGGLDKQVVGAGARGTGRGGGGGESLEVAKKEISKEGEVVVGAKGGGGGGAK